MDYNRLLRERKKISEFIEKATKDYKDVEEKLKSIEKEELSKTIRNAEKPRWGFFW
jgi:BMFP domain-containing protein YqiC